MEPNVAGVYFKFNTQWASVASRQVSELGFRTRRMGGGRRFQKSTGGWRKWVSTVGFRSGWVFKVGRCQEWVSEAGFRSGWAGVGSGFLNQVSEVGEWVSEAVFQSGFLKQAGSAHRKSV